MSHKLNIMTFSSLESTQDHIKHNLDSLPDNTVIVADTQTKGRGRFERQWISPKGGLWFSILKKDIDPESAHMYGFVAATAVAQALKDLGFHPEMKWPNDINIDKKKVCGILVESITDSSSHKTNTIIGIGININNKPPLETSTSLKTISGTDHDLINMLTSILDNFSALSKGINNIVIQWKSFWNPSNITLYLFDKDKTIKGNAVDIESDGTLILERNGKKEKINYAEII